MSDQLRDELLERISEVMSAEDLDVESADDSSENESQRAQAVLARVLENVQSGATPRRHVKRPALVFRPTFSGAHRRNGQRGCCIDPSRGCVGLDCGRQQPPDFAHHLLLAIGKISCHETSQWRRASTSRDVDARR